MITVSKEQEIDCMPLTIHEQEVVDAVQKDRLEVSANKVAWNRTLVALAEVCLAGRRAMHVENCLNLASESLILATDAAHLVAEEA